MGRCKPPLAARGLLGCRPTINGDNVVTSRRLRLAPEWGCYPLWDDATGEPIDPDATGLPDALAVRIEAWDLAFQAILDHAYPPDSKFPTEEAERAYLDEGRAIAAELRQLFGDGFVDRFTWRVRS